MHAVARFGHLGGGLLTATGALGLAVTGLARPLTPRGEHLLLLEVTPAQNLLHLALGLAVIVGAAGTASTARTTALLATAILATLGVVGLALATTADPLALTTTSATLHLGLAAWGGTATLLDTHAATAPSDTTVRHP